MWSQLVDPFLILENVRYFKAWKCGRNGGKLCSVFLQTPTFRVPMNYFQNILQSFAVSVNFVLWSLSVFQKYIASVYVCVCVVSVTL